MSEQYLLLNFHYLKQIKTVLFHVRHFDVALLPSAKFFSHILLNSYVQKIVCVEMVWRTNFYKEQLCRKREKKLGKITNEQ